MTRTRFALFASMAMGLAVVGTVGAVLAVDLFLHHRYRDLVGLNVWGYRGPVVGTKQPGEWRLAFLGGSTAFGYGVHWSEAIPAQLEQRLDVDGLERPVSVVNLAFSNEGAHSYRFTLEDYEYLDYDAVLLYSGYNDLGSNLRVFRRGSVVFRATGYLPIFPMIFQEKARAIRSGGHSEDERRRITFEPTLPERVSATVLERVVQVNEAFDTRFGPPPIADVDTYLRDDDGVREGGACGARFAHYCGEIYLAIDRALDRGRRVLFVTQPILSDDHREQQALLRAFLDGRFGAEPRPRYASMAGVVDVRDPSLAYDGMHLTLEGNRRIAAAMEPHVRELMP